MANGIVFVIFEIKSCFLTLRIGSVPVLAIFHHPKLPHLRRVGFSRTLREALTELIRTSFFKF